MYNPAWWLEEYISSSDRKNAIYIYIYKYHNH